MRPPLLTAKPINSVNMQEISDNLDKIEHSILNRKEDQKQVSSTTFKSTNKSTKHQLSSITSTPAKITSSNSASNNSNNTNLNSVVPVAFMSINALLPYMQKICDDFQNNSNKSDLRSHMLNRFFVNNSNNNINYEMQI